MMCRVQGGNFKNMYELLNLRALKISMLYKNHIFQCMYGLDILCGISMGTFEIPHKISHPYIERCGFYSQTNIQELLDLRAHKCFWNAPRIYWSRQYMEGKGPAS